MKEKPMLGNIIENFLRKLGKPLVTFVSRLGQLSLFIAQSLYNTVTPPFYLRLVGRQFLDIGFYSLPVVALTTILPVWLLPSRLILAFPASVPKVRLLRLF